MFSNVDDLRGKTPQCEECGEEGVPLYKTDGLRVCEECQVELLTDKWAEEIADEVDLQWLLSDEED